MAHPALMIALGAKPAGKPTASAAAPSGGDGTTDLLPVAQELIKAIQSGDAQAVAHALQAAHDICDSYSPDDAE